MEKGVMKYYRLSNFLWRRKVPIIPGILTRLIRVIYSIDLPYTCTIGKNVVFKHNGLGCVIHHNAQIGDNTVIYQNVSIAGRNNRGVPKIGRNCFIGAGACILGGIVIGDEAKIGANTTIIENVPAKTTVVGYKGRLIKKNECE